MKEAAKGERERNRERDTISFYSYFNKAILRPTSRSCENTCNVLCIDCSQRYRAGHRYHRENIKDTPFFLNFYQAKCNSQSLQLCDISHEVAKEPAYRRSCAWSIVFVISSPGPREPAALIDRSLPRGLIFLYNTRYDLLHEVHVPGKSLFHPERICRPVLL